MIFIVLSVVQSTLIFITFKLFEKFKIENWQAIFMNYVIAALLSFFLGNVTSHPARVIYADWLPYSVILGFMFIATFYFFALSSQKAGVAVTSVTSKMSVIIPVVFGAILYNENFGVVKISGVVVALTAFYLVFKKDKKPLLEMKWIFLPVMVFLGNGFVDTAMKYMQHHHIGNDLIPFLMVTFGTGVLLSLIMLLVRLGRGKGFMQLRSVAGGTILGIFNFGSTYYIIKALGVYESSVVFPVANSAIVGLSALAGYFGFREKLSLLNWTGVVLAITAIIIIANA
jgi:drug/metabolite transporter (DMT)-like permease